MKKWLEDESFMPNSARRSVHPLGRPSVRPLDRPLVRYSVGPSVGNYFCSSDLVCQ